MPTSMTQIPTIETLNAVVEGHSRQFETLHKEVADVGRRVESLFGNLTEKLDAQRTSTAEDQRRAIEQQLALQSANKPDYKGFIGVGAATVGVMITAAVVIGSMAINPLRENIVDLKESARADNGALAKQVVEARLSLARLEGQETERHDQYLRDAARLETRENALEAERVNRPELDGVSDTVNRLSARMTEMQHEFGANFTLGDAVKEMQARLNALQLQANVPVLVPPASHGAD